MAQFTPEQRRALLNVLTSDDETRAAKIGELYQKGGPISELLTDLEGDEVARWKVIEALEMWDLARS